jgi:hypothetical protein
MSWNRHVTPRPTFHSLFWKNAGNALVTLFPHHALLVRRSRHVSPFQFLCCAVLSSPSSQRRTPPGTTEIVKKQMCSETAFISEYNACVDTWWSFQRQFVQFARMKWTKVSPRILEYWGLSWNLLLPMGFESGWSWSGVSRTNKPTQILSKSQQTNRPNLRHDKIKMVCGLIIQKIIGSRIIIKQKNVWFTN